MAYASIEHTYAGGPAVFTTNFALGVQDVNTVYVRVNTEVDGFGQPAFRPFTMDTDTGDVTVGGDPLVVDDTVRITRITPIEQYIVDFGAGADVTRRNLQRSYAQVLFAVQELYDRVDGTLDEIEGIAQEVDALIAGLDADLAAAAASAAAALLSENQAELAAQAAEDALALAQETVGVLSARQFQTRALLLADTDLTYTAGFFGTVAAGDHVYALREDAVYTVAASASADYHELTANGVKLYEAGLRFSSLERLYDAVARYGTSVPIGTTLTHGEYTVVLELLDGSPEWVEHSTVSDVLALAGSKIDNIEGGVSMSNLGPFATKTLLGNDALVSGLPRQLGRQELLNLLGFLYNGTAASGGVDLPESPSVPNAPTGFRTGRVTTASSGWTTVTFSTPLGASTPNVVCTVVVNTDAEEPNVKTRNHTVNGFDVMVRVGGSVVARTISYMAQANGA